MKKIIKIIMATDENYILPTKVTIWSMMNASSKEYIYHVHILCNDKLSYQARNKLGSLEERFNDLSIFYEEIDNSLFGDAATRLYWTVESYYRLLIPELITGTRCIFLDCDLIINTDISKLYELEIGDNLIAGVLDHGLEKNVESLDEHKEMLEIPSMNQYVNVGVLVWNLDKMREEDFTKKSMPLISKGYRFMDNDILNKCCYNRIYHLDKKYNMFSEFCDINECRDSVIHFAGGIKPWKYLRSNVSEIWWKAAEKALTKEEFDNYKIPADKLVNESDFSSILNSIGDETVVLFGYSDIGKSVCDTLMKHNKNIGCFCDNSKEKQGQVYNDIEVISLKEAIKKYKGAKWLITSQNYYFVIKNQLIEAGLEDRNILRYIKKDKYYYRSLDKKYYELEEHEKSLEKIND